jgi:hypothetical protein
MERERCNATRRDGEPCQAPAVKGATVCRRHGGAAPQVLRNAEFLNTLREARAAIPYLERWVASMVDEDRRYFADLADGDRPRRCKAHRRDGRPCRCWAIRGGFVCRVHGGAAPQVRAKARARLESARIYREFTAQRSGPPAADPSRTRA